MSGLLINTVTGDLDITDNKLSLTSGLKAIEQRITQRLRLFLGEWFLNRDRGVPWIQQVFRKNPNPIVVDAVIKREIIAEPQVIELQTFELDLDESTRLLTVTFRAKTQLGEINFQEAFGI